MSQHFYDGGPFHQGALGIEPHLTVGDFGSHPNPRLGIETITFPGEKDDTDIVFAVKEVLKKSTDFGKRNLSIFMVDATGGCKGCGITTTVEILSAALAGCKQHLIKNITKVLSSTNSICGSPAYWVNCIRLFSRYIGSHTRTPARENSRWGDTPIYRLLSCS